MKFLVGILEVKKGASEGGFEPPTCGSKGVNLNPQI